MPDVVGASGDAKSGNFALSDKESSLIKQSAGCSKILKNAHNFRTAFDADSSAKSSEDDENSESI